MSKGEVSEPKNKMTPEQLLKPRYKVIADYPGSNHSVGDILYFHENANGGFYTHSPDEHPHLAFIRSEVEPFPHLFRRLEWWEDRKASDLPEYVKCDGMVFKVKEYEKDANHGYIIIPYSGSYSAICADDPKCEPATETDFNQYINKKQ